MKEISDELSEKPPHVAPLNPTAAELGLQKVSGMEYFINL